MVELAVKEAKTKHQETLEIALKYHKAGRCVIPSGGDGSDGKSKGKAALVSWAAFQKESTTESQILQWAETLEPEVWAMVTGRVSGIIVLDADAVAYMKKHGFEPHVITRKGSHFYFRHPGYPVKNKVRLLSSLALDVRGDGGYVNFCGKNQYVEYTVLKLDGLYEVNELPMELQEVLSPKQETATSASILPNVIPNGSRNSTLASLAGTMRRRGTSQEAIEAALIVENKQRCSPPLEDDEVIRIAQSISRYQPTTEQFHLTDSGNAKRLVDRHGHDLRYCYERKKWLYWDGRMWVWDSGAVIDSLSADIALAIHEEALKEADDRKRQELMQHALRSESAIRRQLAIRLAQSEPGIPIEIDELDKNELLLNFENGTATAEITTPAQPLNGLVLRQYSRDDLATKIMPVAYDPNAQCPTWDAFMQRVLAGKQPLITFVQRAVGYSLTGSTKEQCIFIVHGTGANGKSTFIHTISTMLGDYAAQTPTDTLLVKKHDGISNDIARLRGCRFVSAVEVEAGRQLAESLLKQVTGGDKVSARFLYAEFFEYNPTFKLWLAVNHKPIIKGTDNAIWRRIRLIPFTVTIPEDEQDHDLPDKLLKELPGIMAWAVRGCLDWIQNGLGVPEEVKKATDAYRDEMDELGDFITDCCDPDPSCHVSVKKMYEAYVGWCEANGRDALVKNSFGKAMREKGFDQPRINKERCWKGIRIKKKGDKTKDGDKCL